MIYWQIEKSVNPPPFPSLSHPLTFLLLLFVLDLKKKMLANAEVIETLRTRLFTLFYPSFSFFNISLYTRGMRARHTHTVISEDEIIWFETGERQSSEKKPYRWNISYSKFMTPNASLTYRLSVGKRLSSATTWTLHTIITWLNKRITCLSNPIVGYVMKTRN